MRFLVTGGAGFIGSHLCERLAAEGHEVVCLDNFDPYSAERTRANAALLSRQPGITVVEGDILDLDLLERVFQAAAFDRVIHLAALAGVRRSVEDPQRYADVDYRGTINVLQAATRHGAGGFVLGSTSSVYGMNTRLPFREDDRVDSQASPYAVAKRAAELYCMMHERLYGTPVTILRFFTVYGPRQRPDMAIHMFIDRILRGEPITLFGDGSSLRDYTYVDDVVQGTVAAAMRNAPAALYNLGSGRTVTLREMAGTVAQVLDRPYEVEWEPPQPGDVAATYADITRARTDLGYDPRDLEAGLRATVAAWREQPGSA